MEEILNMEEIRKVFENDRFAALNQIEVVDLSPGNAKTRMEIQDMHLNSLGTVHGAVLFTLADFTFALAANSHGRVTVAINVNISYLKAVKSGILTGEARELFHGGRIGSYTVNVYDESHDLVSVFQGTAYQKKEKISDFMNELNYK